MDASRSDASRSSEEIPTLASLGIAHTDLSAACSALEALSGAGKSGLALFHAPGRPLLRRLRKAVAPFLEEMRRKFGVGLDEREHKRRAKKRLNARKHQEMALDRKYKDKTRLLQFLPPVQVFEDVVILVGLRRCVNKGDASIAPRALGQQG